MFTNSAQAAVPAYRASGTFTNGAGAITPPYPASMAANDICLLAVTSENQAISLTTANGFAEVPTWSPQFAGTAATDPASRLAVYWKRTVGGDSAPVVANSGDNNEGQIHCFSGVATSGNPWDTGAGGNDGGANDTTGTIPGAVTTVPDTLVALITSTSFNGTSVAECSGWTNADLTSLTERTDNSNTRNLGGGHCLATGVKSVAGSYTTTAVTMANTTYKGAISLALKPKITTLGNGTDPGNPAVVAPSGAATMADAFTLVTNGGTDAVTAAVVGLASGTSGGLSLVEITDDVGSVVYGSTANPASDTPSITLTGLSATAVSTQYKIRVAPKIHGSMPPPPGSTYLVTAKINSWTSSNTQTGSDTAGTTVTIDNTSPAGTTSANATAGDTQVTVSWTNPADADFQKVIIYCKTASVTEAPTEGADPSVDGMACDATARVKYSGATSPQTFTGLTNNTTYYFRIYARDTNGNFTALASTQQVSATPIPTPDTSPPTPNPMTFSAAPANDSAVQISMTSTTGSDATPPVNYLFTNDNSSCAANAGTGGTASSWQSSTSYSDSGLQANKCYGYTVTARDSKSPTPNTGTASAISSTYTSANTPGTPTLGGATASTLNLTNAENSNPAANPTTNFAVQVVTTTPSDATWLSNYVNASGNPSATAVWLTDAQLDAMVLQGLQSSTLYGVKVKARNQDTDETALGIEGQGTTLTAPDNTAPAAISNLAASGPTQTSINLNWTSPGDDGSTGTATTYDIRYSTATIIEGNWASATQVTGEPAPQIAGTNQSMTVSGLSAGTTYYFAMKTSDEVPNTSALSNIASATTSVAPDTTAPAAVANLAATSTTQTTVGLSWTAPGDDGSTGTATSYDMRYSTSNITEGNWAAATQATGEPAPQIAGTSQSMTVTGLTADTLYYFAIKTDDEVPNHSAISNIVSTSTRPVPDTTAPAAVSNLAASNATQNTIDLAWTSPGDDGSTGTATTYDIRYSTATITEGNWASATQATGEPTPLVAGTNQSMTVSGLTAGTTYYFAIKTADEIPNTSAISNVPNLATLPTADTTAPAAITNLAASNPTDLTIDLAWTSPGDDGSTGTATSYDIRYASTTITESNWAASTQVAGEPTPLVAGTNQSMTVSGLSELTTYYFAMKTADEAPNTSALSNVVSGTTTATPDTTAPAAIADLSTSGATQTTINLNWTAPGDDNNTGTATSYNIRYSTALITDGNWASATQVTGEPAPQIAGTLQSMTITGLSNSTTYFFAIKTADEVPNTSALSNIATGATQAPTGDTTAPAAITNLAASSATESSVHLTWTSPGDDNNTGTANYYDIRYSTSLIIAGNFNSATQVAGEPTPLSAGTGQSMTVTGLAAGTTYYFAMKTADEVPNTSAMSNVVNLATIAAAETPSITIPLSGGVAPTQIRVSGFAFPGAKIAALQKSVIGDLYKNIPFKDFSIDEKGAFSVSMTALLQGEYLFLLTADDSAGTRSGILSYSPDLLSESSFNIPGALFSPTVRFLRSSLAQNETLEISGAAYPESMVEIQIDDIIIGTATTTDLGAYSFSAALSEYKVGSHRVRARQILDGRKSYLSPTNTFRISQLVYPRADMNSDDRVNIVDWSIFLYRWGNVNQALKNSLDLNNDGKVNIADFSVFLKLLTL
ncbi:MAG: fibronectin type III domain-containing protein [Candidatus Niyogibacteria bacterium]|nr:fibronectin type III domain-containing protein [Candidatus Niyogibacteria bacterium]